MNNIASFYIQNGHLMAEESGLSNYIPCDIKSMENINGNLILTYTKEGSDSMSTIDLGRITGVTFTPHISEDGVLTWTNDGGLTNPTAVTLKGKDGEDGKTPSLSIDDNGHLIATYE